MVEAEWPTGSGLPPLKKHSKGVVTVRLLPHSKQHADINQWQGEPTMAAA